jgi:CDP-glucose 4,6-dehydratase
MRGNRNETSTLIRNPNSVRPWQHVLEPISGYLKLGEMLYKKGKMFSGGWNFGPSAYENYSVGKLVDEIKNKIPSIQIETGQRSEELHEAGLLQLDIAKAVNLLGWKPKLNFSETIEMTIDGYLDEQMEGDLYTKRVNQIKNYCKS